MGFAIGIAGIKPLEDLRGRKDAYERELKSTSVAPPDALAAIASLDMGRLMKKFQQSLSETPLRINGGFHLRSDQVGGERSVQVIPLLTLLSEGTGTSSFFRALWSVFPRKKSPLSLTRGISRFLD